MAKPAALALTRPGTLLSTKLDENHLTTPGSACHSHHSATLWAKQGKAPSFSQFVGKLKVKTFTRKTFNLAAPPGANFCPISLSSCSEPLPQPLQLHASRQNHPEFRYSAQPTRNCSYEAAPAATTCFSPNHLEFRHSAQPSRNSSYEAARAATTCFSPNHPEFRHSAQPSRNSSYEAAPAATTCFSPNHPEFRYSAQPSRNSSYEAAPAASYTNPTFLLRVSTTVQNPLLYNRLIPVTGRFMTFNMIAAHGRRLGRNSQ